MFESRSDQADCINRRAFLTAAGTGAAGVLAGCSGSSDELSVPVSDPEDLGDQLPTYTYHNVAAGQSPDEHDAHVLIVDQLEELGFDIEMETFEWGTLFTEVTQEHDFHFSGWLRTLGMYAGNRLPEMFHSRNVDPGAGNFVGYENSELDPKLDEQLSTHDPERREELLHDIQETIAEEACLNPVMYIPNIVVYDETQVDGWVDSHREYEFALNMTSIDVTNEENELRGAWDEPIETLNILGWSNELKIEFHLDQIYDRLIRFDGDLEPDEELSLAVDWDLSPEDDIALYEIRDGHSWHDGVPLTAEDVAFSINYVRDNEIPLYRPQWSTVDHAEALDETTVRIQFNDDEMPGPIQETFAWRMPIIPEHVWADIDTPGDRSIDEPVGSGPMQVEYWDRGSELALERNDDHWNPPSFERRITRIIPEVSTQWSLLRAGDLNYLTQPDTQQLETTLDSETHIAMEETDSSAFWLHGMNTRERGLDELAVRQAIAMVVPNTAIAEQIFNGYRTVPEANNIVSPSFDNHHNPDVWSPEEGLEPAIDRLQADGFGWDEDGMLHFPE